VTTVTELERLRALAVADPRHEAAYLRALLSATLYAHLPLSDDSGRMHLIMFQRPDGLSVIPVFTDLPKAQAAAGGHVRVAQVVGRELLEATRGATLMLDPNDLGMTLYPEEVAALLDEGRAAPAPVAFDGPAMELLPAHVHRDAWLLDVLETALAPIESVQRFHIAAARPSETDGPADRLLVILATPKLTVERAARSIAVALEAASQIPWLPIDLTSYSPDETLPVELADGLAVAWTRQLRPAHGTRNG
jgi:hypothetical protein